MKGPKPIPTALKLLRGNPGRRPLNNREPQPKLARPKCPDFLAGHAADAWALLMPHLAQLEIMSAGDTLALSALCQVYGRWRDAEAEIKARGTVVKSPNGYPILNPHLSVANAAIKQIHLLCAEFGLTPSSRSRVSVPPGAGRPADPFDALMKRKKA